jgi:hypothetical protein
MQWLNASTQSRFCVFIQFAERMRLMAWPSVCSRRPIAIAFVEA